MNNEEENKLIDAIISLSQEIKGLCKEFTGEIQGLARNLPQK